MGDAIHHLKTGNCSRRQKYIVKVSESVRERRNANETEWSATEEDYDYLVTSIQERRIKKIAAGWALH